MPQYVYPWEWERVRREEEERNWRKRYRRMTRRRRPDYDYIEALERELGVGGQPPKPSRHVGVRLLREGRL